MNATMLPIDGNANAIQAIKPGIPQRVQISGSHAESNSFGPKTKIVELFTTTDCWVNLAGGVAAVNDGASFFLGAGLFKCYAVDSGARASVIQDSAGGYLHIIEGIS